MKKNFILVIITLIIVFSLANKVEAKSCEYGIPSPEILYNGSWTYTPVRKFKTSANVCLAKNMSVYFTTGKYIDSDYFTIEAELMEEDPKEYKPDEMAKRYIGKNKGLSGLSWTVAKRNDANLDSIGDQTCELYMRFRLSESSGQAQNGSFAPDMFRYTICVE